MKGRSMKSSMCSSLNSKGSFEEKIATLFLFPWKMRKEERRKKNHSFVHERNLGQVETFAFIPNNRGM